MARRKLLIEEPNAIMRFRETEDGEDKEMPASEFYGKYFDKTVWMHLGATDNYGYKRFIWRPCKIGIFIDMDMPD